MPQARPLMQSGIKMPALVQIPVFPVDLIFKNAVKKLDTLSAIW
jgi:hypothetical protein